jgi:glutamate-1-semialdehyde 2,1-aminomutase
VRLARAITGRDLVAICADQPFFSVDDWFIGSAAMPAGIPRAIRDLTLGFAFDDLPALSRLLDEHDEQVACIVLEAATAVEASPGYFTGLRQLCDERGVLLVLDEMITGFRWGLGGAQALYGIEPDLSTFGKAMGNGFAVSALAGRREHMERGGWNHEDERVFLLSTTHGAETHALAASVAVIEEFRARPVADHLVALGARLAAGVRAAAAAAGVGDHVLVLGHPANLVYATLGEDGERSQLFRTLFMQELLRHGVLAPSFVVSDAVTFDDVDATIEAVFSGCEVYSRALRHGIDRYLSGRPVKPAIRPFA